MDQVAGGAWFHVTWEGNERRKIITGDEEQQHFLIRLQRVVMRFRLRLYDYVLTVGATIRHVPPQVRPDAQLLRLAQQATRHVPSILKI